MAKAKENVVQVKTIVLELSEYEAKVLTSMTRHMTSKDLATYKAIEDIHSALYSAGVRVPLTTVWDFSHFPSEIRDLIRPNECASLKVVTP